MHRECKREPTGANVHFHSRQAAAVATRPNMAITRPATCVGRQGESTEPCGAGSGRHLKKRAPEIESRKKRFVESEVLSPGPRRYARTYRKYSPATRLYLQSLGLYNALCCLLGHPPPEAVGSSGSQWESVGLEPNLADW